MNHPASTENSEQEHTKGTYHSDGSSAEMREGDFL